MFIELTLASGKKLIGNLTLLQRAEESLTGHGTLIYGWNGSYSVHVTESLEEIKKLIKNG